MVITKTPLRISIAGGGTDLPSYYEKFGSMFISAAIDKYIYITSHRSGFDKKLRARYSVMEEVDDVEKLNNEIIKETLKAKRIFDNIEVTSHAEIPSGSGLGSSGSFGVGLLQAIDNKRKKLTKDELAIEATRIQTDVLNLPIGKQDQFAAAHGGFRVYNVSKQGIVTNEILDIDTAKLQESLVMFFTGYNRDANQILSIQKIKSEGGDKPMLKALHKTQEIGYNIKNALEKGDFDQFGQLMNQHWEYKKARALKMTNPTIDHWYKTGLKHGALGGKLIGAGGGGFLLFYTKDPKKLIKNISLKHVPFKFDFEGSTVLVND